MISTNEDDVAGGNCGKTRDFTIGPNCISTTADSLNRNGRVRGYDRVVVRQRDVRTRDHFGHGADRECADIRVGPRQLIDLTTGDSIKSIV